MFDRILVPYDLSPMSKRALDWAISLGLEFHSQIHVLHVIAQHAYLNDPSLINLPSDIIDVIRKQIDDDIRNLLQKSEEEIREAVTLGVEWGDPVQTILERAREINPDLIILGAHGHNPLHFLHLGSVTEGVIRDADRPVLVVRTEKPHWPPQKVLLPVDFNESTEEALDWTFRFCRQTRCRLELEHVITIPEVTTIFPDSMSLVSTNFEDIIRRRSQELLEKLRAKAPFLDIKTHTTIGPIVDEISHRAQESGIDLIIMPTHPHKGLSHFITGSVTEQTVRYAPTNILTLPSQSLPPLNEKKIEDHSHPFA